MAGSRRRQDHLLAVAGKAVKTAQGESDKHPDAFVAKRRMARSEAQLGVLGGISVIYSGPRFQDSGLSCPLS